MSKAFSLRLPYTVRRPPQRRSMPAVCGIVAACVAMGVIGCQSMAPPFEAKPLPTADSYPVDQVRTDQGVGVATTGWRTYYTDPVLQALIMRALENNRDLRIAALRVREFEARYGIRRADVFPTISAAGEASRVRSPGDLSPTGAATTVRSAQVGLGLSSWEIDFWGRLRDLRGAALEEYLASDEARRALVVSLIAQVADQFLTIRELDERLAMANRTVVTREESFRIFTRRYEEGATSKLDLTQVDALLRQAESLRAQLEQARASQVHTLTLLVGEPTVVLPIDEQIDAESMLPTLRPGLPSELLVGRPDIVAAEHQLRAAHANIGAARAAFFPRVTLTGFAGTASAELQDLFTANSQAWTFAPRIDVPIFDGGRNRSNLSLAEVRRDIAVAEYERSIQVAFREVADSLTAQQWLREQVRIREAALKAQTERARLATLRYKSGAVSFLEVLDAERDLLSSGQEVVQSRRAWLTSRVRLYAALGGGADADVLGTDGEK